MTFLIFSNLAPAVLRFISFLDLTKYKPLTEQSVDNDRIELAGVHMSSHGTEILIRALPGVDLADCGILHDDTRLPCDLGEDIAIAESASTGTA